ncbi:unnamed protein product [Vitrella brassicaformis CCMP3155]|uniref:Uncharacterized protein n=2 Tax=Vitrella brassicaformis TaxID=1169539 RepID=A0A0G4EG17_VITBC|nr:unnamed protein product [Vitrella brassicaformis CCMP3155]|eukprot:CEL94385.1 unnamed protein product [Vitrella brassicaformis CCMP3155]
MASGAHADQQTAVEDSALISRSSAQVLPSLLSNCSSSATFGEAEGSPKNQPPPYPQPHPHHPAVNFVVAEDSPETRNVAPPPMSSQDAPAPSVMEQPGREAPDTKTTEVKADVDMPPAPPVPPIPTITPPQVHVTPCKEETTKEVASPVPPPPPSPRALDEDDKYEGPRRSGRKVRQSRKANASESDAEMENQDEEPANDDDYTPGSRVGRGGGGAGGGGGNAGSARRKSPGAGGRLLSPIIGGGGISTNPDCPTSQIRGVYYWPPREEWRVNFTDDQSGKRRMKTFPARRLGFDEAQKLAEDFARKNASRRRRLGGSPSPYGGSGWDRKKKGSPSLSPCTEPSPDPFSSRRRYRGGGGPPTPLFLPDPHPSASAGEEETLMARHRRHRAAYHHGVPSSLFDLPSPEARKRRALASLRTDLLQDRHLRGDRDDGLLTRNRRAQLMQAGRLEDMSPSKRFQHEMVNSSPSKSSAEGENDAVMVAQYAALPVPEPPPPSPFPTFGGLPAEEEPPAGQAQAPNTPLPPLPRKKPPPRQSKRRKVGANADKDNDQYVHPAQRILARHDPHATFVADIEAIKAAETEAGALNLSPGGRLESPGSVVGTGAGWEDPWAVVKLEVAEGSLDGGDNDLSNWSNAIRQMGLQIRAANAKDRMTPMPPSPTPPPPTPTPTLPASVKEEPLPSPPPRSEGKAKAKTTKSAAARKEEREKKAAAAAAAAAAATAADGGGVTGGEAETKEGGGEGDEGGDWMPSQKIVNRGDEKKMSAASAAALKKRRSSAVAPEGGQGSFSKVYWNGRANSWAVGYYNGRFRKFWYFNDKRDAGAFRWVALQGEHLEELIRGPNRGGPVDSLDDLGYEFMTSETAAKWEGETEEGGGEGDEGGDWMPSQKIVNRGGEKKMSAASAAALKKRRSSAVAPEGGQGSFSKVYWNGRANSWAVGYYNGRFRKFWYFNDKRDAGAFRWVALQGEHLEELIRGPNRGGPVDSLDDLGYEFMTSETAAKWAATEAAEDELPSPSPSPSPLPKMPIHKVGSRHAARSEGAEGADGQQQGEAAEPAVPVAVSVPAPPFYHHPAWPGAKVDDSLAAFEGDLGMGGAGGGKGGKKKGGGRGKGLKAGFRPAPLKIQKKKGIHAATDQRPPPMPPHFFQVAPPGAMGPGPFVAQGFAVGNAVPEGGMGAMPPPPPHMQHMMPIHGFLPPLPEHPFAHDVRRGGPPPPPHLWQQLKPQISSGAPVTPSGRTNRDAGAFRWVALQGEHLEELIRGPNRGGPVDSLDDLGYEFMTSETAAKWAATEAAEDELPSPSPSPSPLPKMPIHKVGSRHAARSEGAEGADGQQQGEAAEPAVPVAVSVPAPPFYHHPAWPGAKADDSLAAFEGDLGVGGAGGGKGGKKKGAGRGKGLKAGFRPAPLKIQKKKGIHAATDQRPPPMPPHFFQVAPPGAMGPGPFVAQGFAVGNAVPEGGMGAMPPPPPHMQHIMPIHGFLPLLPEHPFAHDVRRGGPPPPPHLWQQLKPQISSGAPVTPSGRTNVSQMGSESNSSPQKRKATLHNVNPTFSHDAHVEPLATQRDKEYSPPPRVIVAPAPPPPSAPLPAPAGSPGMSPTKTTLSHLLYPPNSPQPRPRPTPPPSPAQSSMPPPALPFGHPHGPFVPPGPMPMGMPGVGGMRGVGVDMTNNPLISLAKGEGPPVHQPPPFAHAQQGATDCRPCSSLHRPRQHHRQRLHPHSHHPHHQQPMQRACLGSHRPPPIPPSDTSSRAAPSMPSPAADKGSVCDEEHPTHHPPPPHERRPPRTHM